MLGIHRVYPALALLTTVALGCGGDPKTDTSTGGGGQGGSTATLTGGTGGSTGGGGTGGSTGGSGGTGGSPLTCMTGEGTVLAVSELFFGDGDNGEWKKYGFNVDGLETTALSKDVCQPAADGEKATAYPDGDDGIDNSFGKNLIPLLLTLYPNLPTDTNNGIKAGVFTTLLKLECLPPEGDVAVLNTKLFGATDLGSAPLFDGTDKWPVAPELLSDPKDPQSSTVTFPKSSVKGTTFDSGKDQNFILTIPIKTNNGTTSIKLTLYAARTTMTLSADRKSATGGIISGVLNTEELITEVKEVGHLFNLCDTEVFKNALVSVRQASDIMTDGTQDPNKTCDGISVGIGFNMLEAQLGDVGPATPVGMACP